MKLHHGGPAFPSTIHNDTGVNWQDEFGTLLPPNWSHHYAGMTLRDYFAAHASEEDVQRYIPDTTGDTADLLVRLGRVPSGAQGRKYEWFVGADYNWLRSWARYRFADDMLKARQQ